MNNKTNGAAETPTTTANPSNYAEYCFQLGRVMNVTGVTEYAAANEYQTIDGTTTKVPAIRMKLRDGKYITITIQDEEVRDKVLETVNKYMNKEEKNPKPTQTTIWEEARVKSIIGEDQYENLPIINFEPAAVMSYRPAIVSWQTMDGKTAMLPAVKFMLKKDKTIYISFNNEDIRNKVLKRIRSVIGAQPAPTTTIRFGINGRTYIENRPQDDNDPLNHLPYFYLAQTKIGKYYNNKNAYKIDNGYEEQYIYLSRLFDDGCQTKEIEVKAYILDVNNEEGLLIQITKPSLSGIEIITAWIPNACKIECLPDDMYKALLPYCHLIGYDLEEAIAAQNNI